MIYCLCYQGKAVCFSETLFDGEAYCMENNLNYDYIVRVPKCIVKLNLQPSLN